MDTLRRGAVETGATFSTASRSDPWPRPTVAGSRLRRPRRPGHRRPLLQRHRHLRRGVPGPPDRPRLRGVAAHGAGGANVWTHDLLHGLLPGPRQHPQAPAPAGHLPGGDPPPTRVGAHAGELLEDLGVSANKIHSTTDRDLLNDNTDLIEAAARLMADLPARRLDATIEAPVRSKLAIDVRTAHLERLDAYLGGRPIGSWDITDNRCLFEIDSAMAGHEPLLYGWKVTTATSLPPCGSSKISSA